MIKVQYYSKLLSDPVISEYFPVTHDGFAGRKARLLLAQIADQAKVKIYNLVVLDEICSTLNKGKAPNDILYKKEGKYYRVIKRNWPI